MATGLLTLFAVLGIAAVMSVVFRSPVPVGVGLAALAIAYAGPLWQILDGLSSTSLGLLFAALLSMPYAAGLLLIRFRQRYPEAWDAERFDPDLHELPPELRAFGEAASERLRAEGFQVVADLHRREQEGLSYTSRVIYMENRERAEVATVVGIFAGRGKMRRIIPYAEYAVRFADGTRLRVTNNVDAALWAKRPDMTEEYFPDERDSARLVRLGRALRERRFPGETVPPEHGGDVVALVSRRMLEQFEHGVSQGRLYRDARRRCFRPTWKGALYGFATALPPGNWLRRAFVNRRGRRTREELGFDPPASAAKSSMDVAHVGRADGRTVGRAVRR